MAKSKLFEEVKAYAQGMIDGTIIANKDRILAAKRFFRDLENPKYEMRTRDADFVIKIIEATFVHVKGPKKENLFSWNRGRNLFVTIWPDFIIKGQTNADLKRRSFFYQEKIVKHFLHRHLPGQCPYWKENIIRYCILSQVS